SEDVLEALEQGECPSVLLTDVRMPGQDGLSLMAALKARHPDVPVIVMTAFTDLDNTVAAFQRGAFDYLPKPFDLDMAVQTIRRAASERIEPGQPDHDVLRGTLTPSSAPAMQDVYRA